MALAAIIGYAVGQVSWVMLICLGVYYLYNLYQLRRFNLWLNRASAESDSEPPESYGLWGDIFDGIYPTSQTSSTRHRSPPQPWKWPSS